MTYRSTLHVCVRASRRTLDEDTHRKPDRFGPGHGCVPQRNVPSTVVLPRLSPRPQEPRRPRFPFFYINCVKEQTPPGGVFGAFAPNFGDSDLLPVARQPICPFWSVAFAPRRGRRQQQRGGF